MLKVTAILSLIFLSLGLHAQLPKGPVIEAKKIPLQGKDPIGDMVQIDGMHSYVFVKDCHQRQDSLGVWHTDFEFGNPNRIIAHNITIILNFDHATDSIIFTTDGIPKNVRTTHPAGNFAASWSAAELSANGTITAIIVSQEKIFTTITGVEGQLH